MIQAFAFYLFATLVIASGGLCILSPILTQSVLVLLVVVFNAAWRLRLWGDGLRAILRGTCYVAAAAVRWRW